MVKFQWCNGDNGMLFHCALNWHPGVENILDDMATQARIEAL